MGGHLSPNLAPLPLPNQKAPNYKENQNDNNKPKPMDGENRMQGSGDF